MAEILSYQVWKETVNKTEWDHYKYIDGDTLMVFTGVAGFPFQCFVGEEDRADYDTNFDADAIEVEESGDPIALIGVGPLSQDQRPVVVSNMFPSGVRVSYRGYSDTQATGTESNVPLTFTNDHGVGSDPEEKVIEFEFTKSIYLAAGRLRQVKNAEDDDWISYAVVAPATSNAVAGTTYDLIGGAYIPPLGGPGNGSWDIDLAETKNANVTFTEAVPVPHHIMVAGEKMYYHKYDLNTDVMTYTPDGDGNVNLFAVEIPLFPYLDKFPIESATNEDFNIPNIEPGRLYPQWIHRLTIRHGNNGQTLSLKATLTSGR